MLGLFRVVSIIRTILVNWFVWVHRHAMAWRIAFLITLTVTSVKAAVRLYGVVYNTLGSLISTGNAAGQVFTSGPTGIGIPLFDKLNAVIPVAETLAFMMAYSGVLTATTVYMFLRSLYKAIPLKAT